MHPYQLVIFDCDGVLVDSERITNQVFAGMLNELGLPLTLEDMFEQFVGGSMAQCLVKITAMLGAPPPDDFVERYTARADAALAAQVTAVPGVEAMLDAIALPYCVASNARRAKMELTLGRTGLLPRFVGRMFSANDVAHPKPAPDLFLHAAAQLGAAPDACIVIEDSPTGVTAAVAAGMTVLGYSALMPAHRLRQAGVHLVFDHMSELPALLQARHR